MAEWKKLVVSGSDISQLNNDAGYLTSATVVTPNSFSTASYDGTDLLADSPSGAINFASSSGEGLTISANAGSDTLTFGLAAIPNTSLQHDGIEIAGNDISLGGSITATTILAGTEVVSGSAQVTALLPAGTVSGSAQVDGASITNNTVSFGGVSVALNGSDSTPAFDLSDATAYPGDSSLVTLGTVTSGDVSAILPAGTVSGSSQVSYTGLSNIPAGIVSGSSQITALLPSGVVSSSVLSSPAQGEALLTTNGVAGSTIDLGLQTTDSPSFAGVTAGNITVGVTNDNTINTTSGDLTITPNVIITGDLTVNGTTTTINTDNLLVEDKFILLASGSTSATDGGIIIQSAAAGTGFAFLYDAGQARWGYIGSLANDATSAAPDAFAAMVLDLANGSTDIAAYQKNGNIKIDTGDIYIYA